MSKLIDVDYLKSIILKVANNNIDNEVVIDFKRSAMPSGHNGPYYDIETPVRNTAHWLCTFSILYKSTENIKYYDVANRLANFLLEPGPNIKDGVYIHRQKKGKDWCNGVIGQAWVIEALNIGAKCLQRPELKDAAIQAAKAFHYDECIGAWVKIDPNNFGKSIDYTLNHQTWFAATIAELDDMELNKSVSHYLSGLENNGMRSRKSGVFSHLLYKASLKGLLIRLRYWFAEVRSFDTVYEKEVGYHLYNLHPLARIYKCIPEHSLFKSDLFISALRVASDKSFINDLYLNKYAYPYNSPAFEYPLIASIFNFNFPSCIIDAQLDRYFDDRINAFYGCPDSNTLNARVYEFALSLFD